MPRRKPIEIGEHHWEFQKDALEYYKTILNRYEIGDSILDEDFNDIFDLVKNHPDAATKIGSGVESFKVDSDGYGGKCFHIVRTDGSTENFSYLKAVKGEASSFTVFCKACRKAVENDIKTAKDNYFKDKSGVPVETAKCQETGEFISKETAHIDHRQPNTFSVIVDRFIEVNKTDISSISYNTTGQYGREIADSSLRDKFVKYHKEKATLRVVNKDLNARRAYQARVNRQKKDIKLS